MKRAKVVLATVLTCTFVFAAASFAQENYPTQPVQMILPFAAGGSSDVVYRILSDKLKEYLGQPFVPIYKPGATGGLAMGFVATAKPDGYNIFACAGYSPWYIHLTNPSFKYTLNDFAGIASIAKYPQVIIVNKDLPVKNLKELAAYAKKNPKRLSYGSTGYGGGGHLGFEQFKSNAAVSDADLPHVPYNGVAPILTALQGNQVQVAILPYSALIGKQMEVGNVRCLTVASVKRSKLLPDIPTTGELGFPDIIIEPYLTLWAPLKTPASIVKKLEDATKKASEDKTVQKKVEEMYHEVEFNNPHDLRKNHDEQVARTAALIKKFNIQVK